MSNPFKGIRAEFHIIQSFPVTCLNRDDVGSPKSVIVGGVNRARVSSQAWKRSVRLALPEFGIKIATRSKKVEPILKKAILKAGATEDQSDHCAAVLTKALADDTLLFISDTEIDRLAYFANENNFDLDEKLSKAFITKLNKAMSGVLDASVDSLDIALFGRMVAKVKEMNVEPASSFSHAITTHKVSNEQDYFTALDDISNEDDSGSSHIGINEYNSGTYYRYVSLDLGVLFDRFVTGDSEHIEDMQTAIEAFVKALFVAIPVARQNTMSGASSWDYARVLVRKGQRLQIGFDSPVKAAGSGYSKPSIAVLSETLATKKSLMGSMFGELADFEWGIDSSFSIDHLIDGLKEVVTKK
jgi:CRISPR system Cascade subunit CasC